LKFEKYEKAEFFSFFFIPLQAQSETISDLLSGTLYGRAILMKTLTKFLGGYIFFSLAFAISTTTTVIAADFYGQATTPSHSESVIAIPEVSNKLRREAGLIIAEEGEESSSGSRGRFAFKSGQSGFAAFSKSRGRFAFKPGESGFAAFSKSRGRFAFKPGESGFAAFSKSRGRFAFKTGESGFAAFSKSRGRFAFKPGESGFAAFSKSRGRFAFKPGQSGFAAFSKSRGRFAFKTGQSGFAAFSKSRGRFAFKRGESGFAAFSKSRGEAPTFENTDQNADSAEALEQPPSKIKFPVIVAPLTPSNRVGLTMTDQPSLFWYLSYWWKGDIEVTLNEFGASEPLIEDTIQPSDCHKHPIHDDLICQLRLADYDVHLKPNKDYEWFIYIVMDAEQRTSDWLASAFIRYTEPSPQLIRRLKQSPPEQQYQVYKEEGFWYDAVNHLVAQIDKQPSNLARRKQLSDWIVQEKMLNVAEFIVEGCEKCFFEIDVE
jgi:hypothetical protein